MRILISATAVFVAALLGQTWARAQAEDLLFDALTHPAIHYRSATLQDPVADLVRKLQSGDARLNFASDGSGYLRSLLSALRIPVESQMAVFSQTSLQSPIISPRNPRMLYFADDVVVAWPRGGFIEIAAQDPQEGVQFYMLRQEESPTPELIRPEMRRSGACLGCHQHFGTLDVPGLQILSVAAGADGRTAPSLANYLTDDRSPFEERWAGWYVTGKSGGARHLGNADALKVTGGVPTLTAHTTTVGSLSGIIDGSAYPAATSDIAALLVFAHQARLTNVLTRAGWEARVAAADHRGDLNAIVQRAASQLVDALFFVDEARLPPGIESGSAFPRVFSARGPADGKGRSLRELDLRTRLMRYPCSYMIYTGAFDGLPPALKDAVYQRMWAVLSGGERDRRYARLSAADRRAIVDILRDTKKDLPAYFK
jgi:hypothetical protein